MKKKRMSKKAQITIFMIIGLIILFAFIFLIQMTNDVKKSKLELEKEKVFSKAFKKEAMRIFVEDCLNDELEEALVLVGKQGRIWSGQPGGVKKFEEGLTGVTFPSGGDTNIFYGITDEEHNQHQNAYPCNNDTSAPEFCQYQHPDLEVGFGETQIITSTIKNDLQRYLSNRTMACILNFTKTNISNKAEVTVDKLNLKLNIQNDGISVKANFPLKFNIGGEEFFHLSTFDFFYPTQFKWLLEAAVSRPLYYDQKYLDFNYTEEILQSPSFNYASNSPECGVNHTCQAALFFDKYSSLGIKMEKQPLEQGDDLFTFSSSQIIKTPGFYEFNFVRQNRPPALDYINRTECPANGYDYLVIKDDNSSLGEINMSLFALDPDEDNISYKFIQPIPLNDELPSKENTFFMSKASVNALSTGFYNLTTTSLDQHGKKDWQNVRILVDRPISLNVSVHHPYADVVSQAGGVYFISNEDPVFVNITFPEQSPVTTRKILFNYSNAENSENFQYLVPEGQFKENGCYSFPWTDLKQNCNISDYTKGDLKNWKNTLALADTKEFNNFRNLTKTGILNLSFSANYCADFDKEDSAIAKIVVASCIPHQNPEFPFAYNENNEYHRYKFGLTLENKTNFSDFKEMEDPESPFLATHSCCSGNLSLPGTWEVSPAGTVCFSNPSPGCYGKILGYTADYGLPGPDDYQGYVLEKQVDYCDGKRGNVCGSGRNYSLWDGELRCGNETADYPGCKDIANDCEGKLAFSLIAGKGWCSGKMGCERLCPTSEGIVYTGTELPSFNSYNINWMAKEMKITNTNSPGNFPFRCGCSLSDDGKPCDLDFNGEFTEVCSGGSCQKLVCAPNTKECSGEQIATCNNDGTGFSLSNCGSGTICGEEGKCFPTFDCGDSDAYYTCTGGVSYYCPPATKMGHAKAVYLADCSVSGMTCENGICVKKCSQNSDCTSLDPYLICTGGICQ